MTNKFEIADWFLSSIFDETPENEHDCMVATIVVGDKKCEILEWIVRTENGYKVANHRESHLYYCEVVKLDELFEAGRNDSNYDNIPELAILKALQDQINKSSLGAAVRAP
jgi:hypothetical protein